MTECDDKCPYILAVRKYRAEAIELKNKLTACEEYAARLSNRGSCETCRWMLESGDGPHCERCTLNAQNNYERMTVSQDIRTRSERNLAVWLWENFVANRREGTIESIQEWLESPIEGIEIGD